MSDTANVNRHGEPGGHEPTLLNLRGVVAAGIALVLLVVLVMFFMRLLFGYLNLAEAPRTQSATQGGLPAAPRLAPLASEPPLSTQPAVDLRSLRAAEDEVLNTYGWIDREAGIARIPIERAVQILAERRLPAPRPDAQEK